MTISHYTYCPCNCHKRLRNIKANYLIAGRCASLFPLPAPMFFGNTFKRKKNTSLETLCKRGTRQSQFLSPHSQGTNNQGTRDRQPGYGTAKDGPRSFPVPTRHRRGQPTSPTQTSRHQHDACPCPAPSHCYKGNTDEGLFSQQSPGLIPRHIPRTHRPSRQNKGNFTQTSRKHRTRQLLSARLEHARHTPSQHVHRSQQGWATEKASSSRPSSFTCYRLEKKEHPFSVKLRSSFL